MLSAAHLTDNLHYTLNNTRGIASSMQNICEAYNLPHTVASQIYGISESIILLLKEAEQLVVQIEENETSSSNDIETTSERLALFAQWTNTIAPGRLLGDDEAPSKEFLEYADINDCSLDWVFRGDLKSLFYSGRKPELYRIQERLNILAEVRGVEPIHVTQNDVDYTMSNKDIIRFIVDNDGCFNWLFAGCVKTLLKSFSLSAREDTDQAA